MKAQINLAHRPETAIAFGPFKLFPSERRLERGGAVVAVGGRSLDILIALTERPGEVISKQDLFARVWPDVLVEESSLRGHVAGLRRALADGEDGVRYVANVPGRGYCFVAPLTPIAGAESSGGTVGRRLPPVLRHLVGREEAICQVAARVAEQRLVTLVGAGGIGKTTVAVAVGHRLLPRFEDAVVFVDLAAIAQPALIAATVAATLGLPVQGPDSLSGLLPFLRDRRLLLILDNCEHLIDAAALLAERLVGGTNRVHILATSREPLRAEDEQTHALPPLQAPPDGQCLSAAEALTYPAVELFMERAAAGGSRFILSDADAALVGEICNRLDGVALAIELAAGRVGAFGLRDTASLLDGRLQLGWHGRRTALPRHQTLNALLDWSYDLLSEDEQRVLRRLSVPVGALPLDAAGALLSDARLPQAKVIDALGGLVAKSLVSVESRGGFAWYRLLEITRAYASEKLAESGEGDEIARRHAEWAVKRLLDGQWRQVSAASSAPGAASMLANARAALEWSLSERGDPRLTIDLAVAAAPLFLDLALLNECARWSETALGRLDETTLGTSLELDLQEALAISSMFGEGNGEQVHAAIRRGLQLAGALGDDTRRLNLLAGQNIFLIRIGDFRGALDVAEECGRVAGGLGDAARLAMADWMLGVSHHLVGHQAAAQGYLAHGLAHGEGAPPESTSFFGYDHRIRALVAFARVLWLRGFSDRAVEVAREVIKDAEQYGHPVSVCISLIYTFPVFFWRGDLQIAEAMVDRLVDYAERYSLRPYQAVGLGLKGKVIARRGEGVAGRELLKSAIETLELERHHVLSTALIAGFAEVQAIAGDYEAALDAIDRALVHAERNGPTFDLPELLRIKADVLGHLPDSAPEEVENLLLQALEVARSQSAIGFELRAARALAEIWSRQGRADDAFDLLAGVCGRFTEGSGTRDLMTARGVLETLRALRADIHGPDRA